MKCIYYILFVFLCSNTLIGQEEDTRLGNIIPNPGFEEYSARPIGWFYSGKHFSKVMKYWSSPSAASPDVFGPDIKVPILWKEKGFGIVSSKNGGSMAGITVVGCGDGKPHCREYIQTSLLDALVIGQQYVIEFWLHRHPGSYVIEDVGVAFKHKRTYIEDDSRLEAQNVILTKAEDHQENGWIKMTARFTATDDSDYMIIGNFKNDLDSDAYKAEDHNLSFGYVYIDDVELYKIAPIVNAQDYKPTWEGKELKPPATFVLQNIFFDTDESVLLPRSFRELDKLIQLLKLYPDMVIRVNGHTDSDGGERYNDELSMRRAEAVKEYLSLNEVSGKRVSVKAFGLTAPIATNDTEEGKQLNRRVEFTIVSM